MVKVLSFLFLCLFLVACNKSKIETSCLSSPQVGAGASANPCKLTDSEPTHGMTASGSTDGSGAPTPEETSGMTTGGVTGGTTTPAPGGSGTLPNEAFSFETNVVFFNTTEFQEIKFRKAIEIIKNVVATEEFRTRVLTHSYGGKRTFVDNGGFTNEQIYQKILDGAESLQRTVDNEMDLEVEVYTAATSTVGYTYANSKRIWVNTKFFNTYSAAGVAHNLFHEWLHKLGFTHASSYSTARDYSVPYAIGDLVGELGRDFL